MYGWEQDLLRLLGNMKEERDREITPGGPAPESVLPAPAMEGIEYQSAEAVCIETLQFIIIDHHYAGGRGSSRLLSLGGGTTIDSRSKGHHL